MSTRPLVRFGFRTAVLMWSSAGALTLAAAETRRVAMKDIDFSPSEIRAHVGDIVEWTNADAFAHTASTDDGSWEVEVAAGGTGSITMRRIGRTGYLCRYHPNMRGTIIVEP